MTRSLVLLLAVLAVVAATAAGFSAVSQDAPGEASAAAVEQPRQAARGPLGSGKRIVFAFGGDVHFEGVLAAKLAASPTTVLDPIEPVLDDADLAMVNLETAVTDAGLAAAKTFTFRAPASAFAAATLAATSSGNPGSAIGGTPRDKAATTCGSGSHAMTLWPAAAAHAAVTDPRCHRPSTATFMRRRGFRRARLQARA